SSFSIGYSSRQGSQYVAQKFTTRALLRYCCISFWYACPSISSGSCVAVVFGFCGAANALALVRTHNSASSCLNFMFVPLILILSIAPPVEKFIPFEYNDP